MATKKEELEKATHDQGCLGKATMDEPIFILRAQDFFAPEAVRYWASRAGLKLSLGMKDPKIQEALTLANQMEKWPNRKFPD